jgi:type IV pilus assembly protein PilW
MRHLSRAAQRGLSLVELMVGISIGLFIAGAATLVVTSQLADTRRLLLDTQLQQDLRATVDIVTRELRRAGSVGGTTRAQEGIWFPTASNVFENPWIVITPDDGEASDSVKFGYRRSPGNEGPFGFKLESGTIKSLIGGVWQELTDGRIMRVTAFRVTPDAPQSFQIPCPRKCPDGSTDCWPTLAVRGYEVLITAESRVDPALVRTLRSHVRVRNDAVRFNHPGVSYRACPA